MAKFYIYCGAPIPWMSKAGRTVTLSLTEAEYYSISEINNEVSFASIDWRKRIQVSNQLQK
jgi:hypothetical protein